MVSMSIILVNFSQQTFNDALWSLEQAKNLDKNNEPFSYWKFCSWSIVSSALCLESYITSHLRSMSDEIDPNIWSYLKGSIGGFYAKIKYLENISDAQIIDESDSDWNNIAQIIQLRNDIVHFNRVDIFNSINETNAENAIKACRDGIKKLHSAIGINYTKGAAWIDKQKSEKYDK